MLLDKNGNEITTKATIANLDPYFFSASTNRQLSTQDIIKKSYQNQWLIYACSNAISSRVSSIKKDIYNISTEDWVYNHEIMTVLNRPNQFMVYSTLIEATVLCLLLRATAEDSGGQCFWVMDSGKEENSGKVDLTKGDIPEYIFPYNDDYVSPITENNIFIGWKFEIPGIPSSRIDYLPNEIIRIHNFNPYNILKGMPHDAAAKIATQLDINSDLWNSAVFSNDATPNGVLQSDDYLTPQQSREVLTSWYENYRGPSNAQRIALLTKGLKFQQLSYNPKDMQYPILKDKILKTVLATFGLNRIAIGDYESINYATIVEGRKMLWEDTYLPIDKKINESLNCQWIRFTDSRQNLEIRSHIEDIPSLKKDYTQDINNAKTLHSMGVPLSLSKTFLNLPISEDDILAYPWLSEQPQQGAGLFPPATMAIKSAPNQPMMISDARDRYSIDYIERVLQPGERTFIGKLDVLFVDQRNYIMDKIDEWASQYRTKAANGIAINASLFGLNLSQEDKKLISILQTEAIEQKKRDAVKVEEEIGKLVNWNIKDEDINYYVDRRRHAMKQINNTTDKKYYMAINDVIRQGEEENFTVDMYVKLLKESIRDVERLRKNHARTIARTETGIISQDTRFDIYVTEGIEYHQWINAHDEKVRADHTDGQGDGGMIIKIGDIFPHTQLRYPLEMMGDASQVINCRCTTIAVEGPN